MKKNLIAIIATTNQPHIRWFWGKSVGPVTTSGVLCVFVAFILNSSSDRFYSKQERKPQRFSSMIYVGFL